MPPIILRTAFSSYSTDRIIGEGGSGRVYEARDESGSTLAIKILNSQRTSRDKLRRFKNEVQFGIRNSHPNIIAISDHGLHDTSPFYVMPLYSRTLRGLISGGLDPAKVLPHFSQIIDGVEAAHIRGIVHRDLKPENVLHGGEDDRLVVADFGIAYFEEEELYTAVETSNQERLANFQYAAPEQRRRAQTVDHRADIYALGLILNEMFTKEVPQGTGYRTIGSISAEYGYLDDLVAQMIRQNPTNRPSSIAKIKEQLIARHNDLISQQRLSALKNTVIRESEIDDPLIADPMSLKAVDFLNGQLILTLSHQVNPNWEDAFRNTGGHRSIMGSGPDRFTFQGDLARVPVSGQYAEQTLNYFKEWLPMVNKKYEQIVRSEIDAALEQKRQKLQREIEREEERRRVLSRLQV